VHKVLNVNDYFQVAMRSGKMHSECGGPECAGHLPFERQATANGSFTIRPTGTTDPLLPLRCEESCRSTMEVSGRRKA